MAFLIRGSANADGGVSVASNDNSFITPGVRLQVPVGSRVSFYGAAGVGYGSFSYNVVDVDTSIRIDTRHTHHGVFDFGGGMDFRLTRLLSLRGEVRDYVTGKGLGGEDGRNHLLYVFGLAFHF